MHLFAACAMLMTFAIAAPAQPILTADFEAATGGVPDGWRFSADRGECAGAWDDSEPPPSRHSIRWLSSRTSSSSRNTPTRSAS